jgi:hypothetical protein
MHFEKGESMLKRITCAVAVAFIAFISLTNTNTSKAQDAAGRTISVIPPSFELYANPGESITDKIRVRNDSAVETSYTIMVEDFQAVGEEGQVNLIDDSQPSTTYSLAQWVTPTPSSFSLKPGAEREVTFSINVPKDAEPGGHYCSVLVKMGGETKTEGSGASVSSRVGSLILLRVSGNVKEEASVESFTTNENYYEKSPINFELRVKNAGNNHIRPKGTIVITNIFGQKVTEIPLNGMNVLPDAIRKMDTKWEFSASLASRYTATLVANYGQQNKPLSESVSFWVFPKYLGYVVGGVLVLIIILIVGRKRVRKILHNLTK